MTEMRLLTTDELLSLEAAVAGNDRVTYWSTLASAGDSYAKLALEVVLDNSLNGRAANAYMVKFAQREFEEGRRSAPLTHSELHAFGVDLMQSDYI